MLCSDTFSQWLDKMSSASVQIKGLDTVMRHLKMMANPKETLDNALLRTATVSLGELQRATLSQAPRSQTFKFGKSDVTMNNLSTGDLSRSWTNPTKVPAGYSIINDKQAGKHSLANIIDKGRKALTEADLHGKKAFYIPLTRAGQNKRPGAKTTGLKFGIDFLMTKKIKAFAGHPYLEEIRKKGSRYLTANIVSDIRRALAS